MSLFSKKADPDIRIVSEPPRSLNDVSPRSPNGKGYGIAEAIQLMRGLPVEQNVELVVAVIRNTLQSLNVHLTDIIQDAAFKEKTLQQRIETLKGEIAEHEKQIDTRSQEIGRLHSELAETTTVKERLMLADSAAPAAAAVPAAAQPAAAGAPARREGAPPLPPQFKPSTPTPTPTPISRPSVKALQALQAIDDVK
jgi:hypothetical protein